MANVIDYDEWLEEQTQKEIERKSQIALSPKSILSVPRKDGVVVGSAEIREMNQTAQVKSAGKLAIYEGDEDGEKPQNAESKTLADTIQENLKNARPKTRGDPIIQNLDQTPEPTGELNSKNTISNFNSRRKTHDNSDTGTSQKLS